MTISRSRRTDPGPGVGRKDDEIGEGEAVLSANARFYRAFAEADIGGMEEIWATDEEAVTVIHPGVSAISGRHGVLEAWRMIFEGASHVDIEISDVRVVVHGDVAIVLCVEHVAGRRMSATNVFRMAAGGWRLVHHQAGPCHQLRPTNAQRGESLLH
jgi:ketosteroid isomerase-like protein